MNVWLDVADRARVPIGGDGVRLRGSLCSRSLRRASLRGSHGLREAHQALGGLIVKRTARVKLAGAGPESARDVIPGAPIREARWQVQDDAAHRGLDADADLDQPLAERRDLRAGACGA